MILAVLAVVLVALGAAVELWAVHAWSTSGSSAPIVCVQSTSRSMSHPAECAFENKALIP